MVRNGGDLVSISHTIHCGVQSSVSWRLRVGDNQYDGGRKSCGLVRCLSRFIIRFPGFSECAPYDYIKNYPHFVRGT